MDNNEHDMRWMNEALKEAGNAFALNEIPVGAVVVHGDECIGRGYDQRESRQDPAAHAEIMAMKAAAESIGDWRLDDCDLYVTLEPCPMCAGAILMSRVRRLVYGAPNLKFGAVETHCRLLDIDTFNHKVEVVSGVRREEAGELLRRFFTRLRKGEINNIE